MLSNQTTCPPVGPTRLPANMPLLSPPPCRPELNPVGRTSDHARGVSCYGPCETCNVTGPSKPEEARGESFV